MCDKCYKLSRCFEQRGRCAEFRDIDEIRNEIQAVMQASKLASTDSAEDTERQGDIVQQRDIDCTA